MTWANSLIGLPAELQHLILDNLYGRDCLQLSCTCSFYRDLLAHRVFESFTLRNTEESGRAALALSDSRHGQHVQKLHYAVYAVGSGLATESDNAFPLAVEQALANRRQNARPCFPNLRELIVSLDFDFGDLRTSDDDEDFFTEYVCTSQLLVDHVVNEESYAWLNLIKRSYDAISQNNNITSLHLSPHLPPVEVSTWLTQPWRELLGRLREFSIELQHPSFGTDEEWSGNAWMGPRNFQGHMRALFVDHLSNVIDFYIDPTCFVKMGPCCEHGHYFYEMPFAAGQMPHLRFLTVGNVYFDDGFLDMCHGLGGTLERLDMHDCHSAAFTTDRSFYMVPPTWGHLFHCLAQSQPTKLQHMNIMPVEVDCDMTESEQDQGNDEDERNVISAISAYKQVMIDHEHTGRRAFDYAGQHDDYGFPRRYYTITKEMFLRGDDQDSYDLLLGIIESNKANVLSQCRSVR